MSVIYINPYQFAAAAAYDPDAQSYITAVEAADGQALEVGVRNAINAFVVGCKADGTWNAIKASCILAGARTLNGALQPLAGTAPTNIGLSGYDRKTGLIGTGVSGNRLDSNYVIPTADQNNLHAAAWVYTQMTVPGNIVFGNADGVQTGAYPANTSTAIVACNSGNATDAVTSAGLGVSTGIWSVSRNNANSFDARIGTFSASVSRTSATPPSSSICLFGGNTAPFYPSNARLAFYSIGEAIDLDLLDARVTALINAIGAAIP